jgi:putative endonuclease
MREETTYYVYIMASRSRTLPIGMTSRPERRVAEHKSHAFPGSPANTSASVLSSSSGMHTHAHPCTAIAREKQLKGWLRARKIALIEQRNPAWIDLSEGWGRRFDLNHEKPRA